MPPPPPKRDNNNTKVGIRVAYEKLVASVIRPPRVNYDPSELGPRIRRVAGRVVERVDYELLNQRGEILACSRWSPKRPSNDVVVYLHSNSSCRLAAVKSPVLETVSKSSASLVAFDFSGCGRSEGDYVTLGVQEKDDVATVVEDIRRSSPDAKIILWGRSMGAVSAILFGQVDAMVLDSPFSSMRQLVDDVAKRALPRVPSCCVGCIAFQLRRSAKKRTRCDVLKVSATEAARVARAPALFIAADRDALAPPDTHSAYLASIWAASATIVRFDGEHNSPRPAFIYDKIARFCTLAFKPPWHAEPNLRPRKTY
ncbi:hypothetical protein CTAYLR_005152 [Chrysophaeum taylorii]|uniref:Serine aminopeptidase S33 domain-containing protein n=1 Tax=Chrysophaeum taylorii TaxID=2483200 RepID=A0AAD7ULJ6_9STRA|nr:hypothetical protein CTAYLR_005152 [Chrysophaeum taylorii]